jgi:hypothetical protein
MSRRVSWQVTVDQFIPDDIDDEPDSLMEWANANSEPITRAIFDTGIGPSSVDGFTIYDEDGDIVVEHY